MAAFKLNQRRIQGRGFMSQLGEKANAGAICSHGGCGTSSHGVKDIRRKNTRTICQLNGPAAASGGRKADDLAIGHHLYARSLTSHA